jgi:hypothetical protein
MSFLTVGSANKSDIHTATTFKRAVRMYMSCQLNRSTSIPLGRPILERTDPRNVLSARHFDLKMSTQYTLITSFESLWKSTHQGKTPADERDHAIDGFGPPLWIPIPRVSPSNGVKIQGTYESSPIQTLAHSTGCNGADCRRETMIRKNISSISFAFLLLLFAAIVNSSLSNWG